MRISLPKGGRMALSLLLLASGIVYIGYFLDRSEFLHLLAGFSVAFAGYLLYLRSRGEGQYILLWGMALRLLLIAALPTLSDDYFRFIWDGLVSHSEGNPFSELPSYYLSGQAEIEGLDDGLFQKLNSPDYYTVYPPLCQLWFWLAAAVGGGDVWVHVLVMRLGILIAEASSLFAIKRLLEYYALPAHYLAWYALNPLVIVEFTGNLHFEAFMIAALLWAGYALLQKHWLKSAIYLSVGILAKLLPLMLLPALLPVLGWKKSLQAYGVVLLIMILGFLPFVDQAFIGNISESLNLYFQQFEFNASLYYVVRWVGYQVAGHNIIQQAGPVLSLLALMGILSISFLPPYHAKGIFSKWMWVFAVYLLGSTVVHPWYSLALLPFSLFTPYRFPFVWSFSVILSYATYQTEAYKEHLWLVGLSYAIVIGYAVWERFFRPKRHNPLNTFMPSQIG